MSGHVGMSHISFSAGKGWKCRITLHSPSQPLFLCREPRSLLALGVTVLLKHSAQWLMWSGCNRNTEQCTANSKDMHPCETKVLLVFWQTENNTVCKMKEMRLGSCCRLRHLQAILKAMTLQVTLPRSIPLASWSSRAFWSCVRPETAQTSIFGIPKRVSDLYLLDAFWILLVPTHLCPSKSWRFPCAESGFNSCAKGKRKRITLVTWSTASIPSLDVYIYIYIYYIYISY